jgi:DNA-binding MarR family transcriptional regulator
MDSGDPDERACLPSAEESRIQEALAAQRAVFRALLGSATRDWIELDLSMGQLKALMALATHQGLNITALAELLGVGKPAASMLVERLVRTGYVERREDPTDRRRAIVAPTAAGNALVTRLRQGGGGSRMARWLARMAPADLEALSQGLRVLAAIATEEERSVSSPATPSRTTPSRTTPSNADPTAADSLALERVDEGER